MWHAALVQMVGVIVALFTLVVGVIAFIHCATQSSEGFPVLGTLQKPAWLAIIGLATLFGVLLTGASFGLFFQLVAIAASALYLLDVRPGLKDIADGRGPY